MKKNLMQLAFAALGVIASASSSYAYVTLGSDGKPVTAKEALLKTTAGCKPSTANIDLDINNVRARLMTGGDMWYNTGSLLPAYEVPKGGQKHSLYAGSCWIGGIDGNGQLKVSAQLYRSLGNDYWPGPIDKATVNITAESCSEWDRFWKVSQADVDEFIDIYKKSGPSAITDKKFDVIKQWPATGNIYAVGANNNSLPELLGPVDAYGYAPFVDVDNNGIYNWQDGDYPKSYAQGNPDQFIWWVFNDVGNTKTMTKTQSIGMEVQTSAFAYKSSDFLNDATFYNYRLINRGNLVLDSCFIATWTDADLGSPFDDYIGCDTTRGLGILYNGETPDAPNGQNTYGTRIPMIAVDFFIGPRKYYTDENGNQTSRLLKMRSFSYFEGTLTGPVRDPRKGSEFYFYMTGSNADGDPFSNDQTKGSSSVGYGSGPVAPYVFYGDPANTSEWSMCACKSPLKDRRFIHSSGPFTLFAGEKNDITIGVVWVDDAGACGTTSFKKIRAADDVAQALFDQGFNRPNGPDAPVLTVRELDQKLIFYISNPERSNNFSERYGDPDYISDPKYRVTSTKAVALGNPDSIYRFEGYRVFQLKDSSLTNFYDEKGNLVDGVVEVFQCDIKNGVKQITNYTKNLEIVSTIDQYDGAIKVTGKDSGIVHSFVLTEDKFASGSSSSLVNYKTYYYAVVAYAYNNFAPFDPHNEVGTQKDAYFESKSPNKYSVMPNPMNQRGDTFLNSAYGDGVIVTRIEGIGNGGIDVQLNDTSEAAILLSPTNQIPYPTYVAGKGPIKVKVIDPVKVPGADWRISLSGTLNPSDSVFLGLNKSATWKIERLDDNGSVADVIYSERTIGGRTNEQLLSAYGLSVTVEQVTPPGYDQTTSSRNPNGYITSDITYANTSLPWLSGVHDGSGRSYLNWIRSGSFSDEIPAGETAPTCGPFDDYRADSIGAFYSRMFANNTDVEATWAPFDLVATSDGPSCGYSPLVDKPIKSTPLLTATSLYKVPDSAGTPAKAVQGSEYPNVDLVFTSDKSKWTRCIVLEAQYTPDLAEGNAVKLQARNHRSWNMGIDNDGNPVYSSDPTDVGYSWFPGYAINQLTGERLNIAFAEDSYLRKYNGADMIWNPTSDVYNSYGETVFGGRHFTYILNTKYDSCKSFAAGIKGTGPFVYVPAYRQIRWVGIPLLNSGSQYLSLKDGLIPTETRMRFRVNTPYNKYKLMDGQTATNSQLPLYKFSTKGMATQEYTEKTNADALMDKIFVVPNPYKGEASGGNSYETNRLETRVKIINLPVKATVHIYALDGTLVRKIEKDNNDPAIVWDMYNQAGLPIASGMYLIHINAYGKDKVIRWFGAMRPLDVTNY
ncbi:hypothetical protein [Rurimicrobium arvi]|uniref:T9SS type A sorting domain-containing protein n=1 Tax=Rurimicrobium arvi TaxID=2049916 RepID=A0ABP8MHU0_9BACT